MTLWGLTTESQYEQHVLLLAAAGLCEVAGSLVPQVPAGSGG